MIKRLIAAIFLTIASSASAQESIEATISGGIARPIPMAIPDFYDETGNAADLVGQIREIVAYDLDSTGLFKSLPKESYLGAPQGFNAPVDFASWSGIGAEGYIQGSVASLGGGDISVKFRLYDVIAQKEMGDGLEFTGPAKDWRRMAHKVADAVYSRLSGEGSYFDSRIVFVSESGSKGNRTKKLAVMDSDGANVRYLTDGSYLVFAPRWAGNTRDIIFTSYQSGQPQIVLMNTASGETAPLADLPGLAFSPRFSPDGKTVLVSLIDDAGNTDIYSVSLSTGERKRLTNAPSIETAPSYSPDGKKIVFESDRSGSQKLYVMPASGGDATLLSRGNGKYATPVWSPRGDLIAFTKIEGGKFHIGTMGVDGSGENTITSAFIDEGPSWAPNGRVIMFFRETAGAGGAPRLKSIGLTGRNMVDVPTPEFASDPDWSKIIP